MLSDRHRAELEVGSGLTSGVIEARGYRTVDSVEELIGLGFSEDQARVPALLVPLWFAGEIVLHQIKADDPRVDPRRNRPLKYETPLGARMRLDIHPLAWDMAMDPSKPLFITEGLKKADSALVRGVPCVGLLGVYNFRGANDKGGIADLEDWSRIPFRSRNHKRPTYIVYDSGAWENPHVRKAMVRLGRCLRGYGAQVNYVRLMPNPDGSECKLDDYWKSADSSPEQLMQMLADAESVDSIRVGGRNPAEIMAEAEQALIEDNDPPRFFLNDRRIVRVIQNERKYWSLEPVSSLSLAHALNQITSWHTVGRKGDQTPTGCPREIAETLLCEGPALPPILGITHGPVLNPDKSFSTETGYCPKSKLYRVGPEIEPFRGTVEQAAAWLKEEIWFDFPFRGVSDLAHAFALALLPIVRPVIAGPTPIHLFTAPAPGTGKSLLAQSCLMMTQGGIVPSDGETRDPEEWRKNISSALLAGRRVIFTDNVNKVVDSAALARAVTEQVWSDRSLGSLRMLTLLVDQVFVMTANNPSLSKELVDRSVLIHLDCENENPRDRRSARPEGFRSLKEWIPEHEAECQAALMAICERWVLEGCPEWRGRALGTFNRWSAIMGGILMASGIEGFLGNIEELRASSASQEAGWSRFYGAWHQSYADMEKTPSELWHLFALEDELVGLIKDGSDRSMHTQVGLLLKSRIGVVCAGLRVVRSGRFYRIEEVPARASIGHQVDQRIAGTVLV